MIAPASAEEDDFLRRVGALHNFASPIPQRDLKLRWRVRNANTETRVISQPEKTSGEATCVHCQRRRIPCIGQEIPESLALAGKGNRGLVDRISKIEDAMKDLVAGKESHIGDTLGNDASGLTPSSDRAPSTPVKTLREYSVPSAPLASSPTSSDRFETEPTASHSLWAAFPGEEDVKILLPESLRTSRYTYAVNTQPHAKLTLQTLGAPYLSRKCPSANTHPVILAKCMLMYAITLQAPCEEFIGLSEPPAVLSRRWVTAAVTWLATQEETQGSIESLVCIVLEALFETNCGNLRKAWVIYRRAMTIAQIMGLHRSPMPPLKRIDPVHDVDPEFMWFRIIYMDRYLSLLLGLPQGTTDKSIGALTTLHQEPPLGQFERQLTVIASRILERNERPFTTSELTTTSSIDSELLRISDNMPASFWRPANFQNVMVGSPENLLEAVRLAAQVYYYGLLIQLHLPYMMHGISGDADHEYSKITCVNASREIITRFIAHRSFQPKSSCSRPVDFFALLAAMTLLLAHLDSRYRRDATNFLAHQRFSDRALLDQVLERMDAMRDENKDIVMEGSGKLIRQLLEIEADAASGSRYTASSVERDDEVQGYTKKEYGALRLIIPYLGTIKITRQGPISLEPFQESAAGRQSHSSHTEFSYSETTHATRNNEFVTMHHLHTLPMNTEQQPQSHLTQNSPLMEDILGSGQLNQQMHTPGEEQQCLLQSVGNDDTAMQSHLDLPDIAAGINDWAFQGADGAFFDSLLRGCSGLDK
ncbi:Putative transcription factor SEF1 [Talaromyces islandicus]|uniref:Putative transcription factor SEF1 n=1 Tax=Talaromyces islandicus TaxID=28573 RepID=A0A0U1LIK0_TALIS|nr:Putative transcription factor SEF1 [Talaromyces islandicus]